MSATVRYYSRSGNTKKLAEAIAEGAGVKAVSTDAADAAIKEPVDILFIGGALYAYGIDKNLKQYLDGLDGSKVKKAVVFSTSWLSKHALDVIKKSLEEKGIAVDSRTCYVKSNAVEKSLEQAKAFAASF